MKYDAVIIGGGLAGLQCGYILSQQGYKVCLLEQHSQAGGCLQTFRRGDALFDTGFHYVGGLDEGQPLHRLFRYFGLLHLPWQKMDEEGFAEVVLGNDAYRIPSGYERFTDALTARFPHQREGLERYVQVLKEAEANLFRTLTGEPAVTDLFGRSAWQFMHDTITDPELRSVLAGASLTMDMDKETLPLYVFAQINNSFIRSAWRLEGGGSQVTDSLAQSIRNNGGEVRTGRRVTRLHEDGGRIARAVCHNGEEVEGDWFISALHPAATLELIPQTPLIRNIYRKRIAALPNACGMFTTHIRLKKNRVPYARRNIFLHKGREVWNTPPLLVSSYPPEEGGAYCDRIDLLTPMHAEETARWTDTRTGRRGREYEDFKQRKADACIDWADAHLPGLKAAADKVYTSTPLTYRDYTGTPGGSAFGIRKDYANAMGTLIPVQTQVPNLLLSGQSLNLHGVLGVSITSVLTCARITGREAIARQLIND